MTSLLAPELLGYQEPRLRTYPAAAHYRACEDAVKLAAKVGLHLDPWQQLVLRHSLAETPEKKWAARQVGLLVPRQNGKGVILEARTLAGLFLFAGDQRILHTAHRFDTAKDAYERLNNWIDRSPHLSRRVADRKNNNQDTSITLDNGKLIRFKARSSASGRGFQYDTIIFDEAYALTDDEYAAVAPTQLTRPNPQTWYTSSPPVTEDKGEVLQRIRDLGRKGKGSRFAFFEWSADPSADLDVDSLDLWAQANPALGQHVSIDEMRTARDTMPRDKFVREHLGLWADASMRSLIPADVWLAQADTR